MKSRLLRLSILLASLAAALLAGGASLTGF
jgi:hypothetical protein